MLRSIYVYGFYASNPSKGLSNSAALSLINVLYSSHGRPHNNVGYKLGIFLHESIQVQVAIPFP